MIYTHTVRSVTLKEARVRWIFSDVLAPATRERQPRGLKGNHVFRRLNPRVIMLIVVLVFGAKPALDQIGIV